MAKTYCPECKKMLVQVLSSFECLSTWDKTQDYYAPGAECKLVKRCPECGTLTKDKERKINRELKMMEDVKHEHLRGKMRARAQNVKH